MATQHEQKQHTILIIGAGLAGLGLAQGLKKANTPFRIFERDTSASFRAQGYRIRLSPDGAAAIKRLVPEHLYQAFEVTCAEMVHGGTQLDVMTGEESEFMGGMRGPPRAMGVGKAFNADRAVLREVLMRGLEGRVEFGKRVEGFEVVGEEVVARFGDGSEARGGFLVGADGIRSVVRKHLVPEMKVLDTEGRTVFGKTVITEELMKDMHPKIGQGITITDQKYEARIRLFCDGMRFDREQADPVQTQLGIHVPPDYIYWVLVFRSDMVSEEQAKTLHRLSEEQSAQLSVDMTSNWSSQLRAVMKHQKVNAASTLAFLTASPDFASSWNSKPENTRACATLIGDAAHPAPPVGGIGANAGFQDASALCDTLIQLSATATQHERVEAVVAFEEAMLKRASSAVETGVRGGGHFFNMKPVAELKEVAL